MKKTKSTLPKQQKPASVAAADVKPFGRTFILKDGILTPEPELPDDGEYYAQPHLSKENASALVFTNRALLFGGHTIGFGVQGEDNKYPFDALMFDMRIPEKPRLYLLALATELTPVMLSLIALNGYTSNKANRNALLEKLAAVAKKDKSFVKAISAYLTNGLSLETLLENAVRKGLRGLCLFNTDDQKDAEIVISYMGAHGGQIDVIFLRLYKVGKHTVVSMIPSFDDLKVEAPKQPKEKVVHAEADHFARGTDTVRSIYEMLKKEALKLDKSLIFVPDGKHYIAMKKPGQKNVCFFHFRKNTMYLVVKVEEEIVRKIVKHHDVRHLPESVCKFWGAASTGLVISSTEYLKEIIEVFKKLIKP